MEPEPISPRERALFFLVFDGTTLLVTFGHSPTLFDTRRQNSIEMDKK